MELLSQNSRPGSTHTKSSDSYKRTKKAKQKADDKADRDPHGGYVMLAECWTAPSQVEKRRKEKALHRKESSSEDEQRPDSPTPEEKRASILLRRAHNIERELDQAQGVDFEKFQQFWGEFTEKDDLAWIEIRNDKIAAKKMVQFRKQQTKNRQARMKPRRELLDILASKCINRTKQDRDD